MTRIPAAQPMERTTVNLTPRSIAARNQLQELTGDNKTEVMNRALRIAAYVEQLIASGGALYAREPDGELVRVTVL